MEGDSDLKMGQHYLQGTDFCDTCDLPFLVLRQKKTRSEERERERERETDRQRDRERQREREREKEEN